jgi:simple sugar transport system ATP-binding protein
MPEALLQARGIVKHYGHVEALRGCDFDVYPNEIVALIGDNGAGKSTLIKILAGSEQADEGTVFLEGHQIHVGSPFEAMRLGIETVYQDLALAPDLDGSANLYLGRELMQAGLLGKLGFLDNRSMRAGARKAFGDLGVDLKNAQSAVANLSGGQRQSVAVARSVAWASTVVFRPPASSKPSGESALVAWRRCSSATTCARSSRSPTGSKSSVSVVGWLALRRRTQPSSNSSRP